MKTLRAAACSNTWFTFTTSIISIHVFGSTACWLRTVRIPGLPFDTHRPSQFMSVRSAHTHILSPDVEDRFTHCGLFECLVYFLTTSTVTIHVSAGSTTRINLRRVLKTAPPHFSYKYEYPRSSLTSEPYSNKLVRLYTASAPLRTVLTVTYRSPLRRFHHVPAEIVDASVERACSGNGLRPQPRQIPCALLKTTSSVLAGWMGFVKVKYLRLQLKGTGFGDIVSSARLALPVHS